MLPTFLTDVKITKKRLGLVVVTLRPSRPFRPNPRNATTTKNCTYKFRGSLSPDIAAQRHPQQQPHNTMWRRFNTPSTFALRAHTRASLRTCSIFMRTLMLASGRANRRRRHKRLTINMCHVAYGRDWGEGGGGHGGAQRDLRIV